MRISIDIDGTLLTHLEFFTVLISSLQSQGHKILILTCRTFNGLRVLDFKEKINFDEIITKEEKYSMYSEEEYKLKMIEDYRIDYHFDDKVQGPKIFNTPLNIMPFIKGNDEEL